MSLIGSESVGLFLEGPESACPAQGPSGHMHGWTSDPGQASSPCRGAV